MRTLFLTFQFPYPPDNGARIKTLSILDYITHRHDVSVACLARLEPEPEQLTWAEEEFHGGIRWVVHNRGRNVLNLTRSYLSGRPLSIERNRSAEMSRLVREEAADDADDAYEAIFVDGWLMAQYVPQGFQGLRLLHEHNAEYVLWERQARLERGLRGALVRREAKRVRRYEAGILHTFDALFAVSEQDRAALLAIGADAASARVLPNLPDPALLQMPPLSFEESEPVILYFGTLSWQPNIDGLERLVRRVFPLVRQKAPEARLVIAGRDAPPALERLTRGTAGVDFLGPVADAEVLYRQARVFVEATTSGGGTKLKILNALARGLPVVASPEAAEGIEADAGDHLLVAADEEAMASDIVCLLTDGALWGKLSENGRARVRDTYVAEKAFAVLDEFLPGDKSRAR